MVHDFAFLSASAYLCGVACLAALFVRVQKKRMPLSAGRSDLDASRWRRFCKVCAAACALAGFLFMPTASFPTYVSCIRPVLIWIILFGAACAGLAYTSLRHGAYPGYAVFATPVILGTVYAICARYACLRGFPGNLWSMESMMAVPLYSGANPVETAGILCLAGATVLHCATALGQNTFEISPFQSWDSSKKEASSLGPSFLRACVQIASTQFIFCLFLRISASQTLMLPPVSGLLADYVLHWCCTAVMVLAIYPALARLCRVRWAAVALLGMGVALLSLRISFT